MPIYTYQCLKCDAPQTDYLVKFSDPVPACRACNSTEQEKQVSTGTATCLMGYGWTSPGMNVNSRR